MPAPLRLLLEPAGLRAPRGRARHRHLAAGARRSRGARGGAAQPHRRRASGPGRSRGPGGGGAAARPLYKPHHERHPAPAGAAGALPRARAGQCPDLHTGHRGGALGSHRGPPRVRAQADRRGLGEGARLPAHPEHRAAPGKPRPGGGGGGSRRAARRRPPGARQRAVSRLGSPESRRAPAHARAARPRPRGGRRREDPAAGKDGGALRHARLLHGPPPGLHGRLGAALHRAESRGAGPALSRGAHFAGSSLRLRAGSVAGRHLARLRRIPGLSRRGLDGRALPELRPARNRLRRVPVPGVPPHRQRRRHRPHLPVLARSRPDRDRARGVGSARIARSRVSEPRRGGGLGEERRSLPPSSK